MLKRLLNRVFMVAFVLVLVAGAIGIIGRDKLSAALSASLPANSSDNRLIASIESLLADGSLSEQQYDSLYSKVLATAPTIAAPSPNDSRWPAWLAELHFTQPKGMIYLPGQSDFTSELDASAGFNSAEITFLGLPSYLHRQAASMANQWKLAPVNRMITSASVVPDSCLLANYTLNGNKEKYLISIEVKDNGKMRISITDRAQLEKSLKSGHRASVKS